MGWVRRSWGATRINGGCDEEGGRGGRVGISAPGEEVKEVFDRKILLSLRHGSTYGKVTQVTDAPGFWGAGVLNG
jgi:hypothetical protein